MVGRVCEVIAATLVPTKAGDRVNTDRRHAERYACRYYIRTSRTDLDEKSLWQLYVTLGGMEDSFRSLKDELGIRPVFHSKSTRIKEHLFIAVLGYRRARKRRYLRALKFQKKMRDAAITFDPR